MLKIILAISSIQALAVFTQLVKSKVVAVYLGPAGVGVVSTIDQFVQLTAFVVTLNIGESSIKFLSRAHSESDKSFKQSYAGFLKLLLLLSAVGTLLTIGLVWQRNDVLGAELEKYRDFLMLGLLTIPIYVLGLFFARVFAAAQNYNASSMLALIANAWTTVSVIVGVTTAGMFGFYAGNIFSGTLLTIGILIYLWKRYDLSLFGGDTKVWRQMKDSPNVVSFTIMFYLVAVANSLSYLVARYTILSGFGETEAGLLHAAMALSLSIGLILNPVVKLYFTPIVNRNTEKTLKIDEAIVFQKRMVILLSLAALPVVLFPQLMLTVLFSEKFTNASRYVFLFVVAQFVFQIAYINLTLLVGTDDFKGYAAIYVLGQLLFVVLSLFLAPHSGIAGVAYAHIISSFVMFALTLIRLVNAHGFSVSINLWMLLTYTISILTVAGAFCLDVSEWNINGALLKIGFFFLFAASLFFFLDETEKTTLLSTLQNRIAR